MSEQNNIRVIDYTGDYDTMNSIIIISGYGTAEERDADIARLYALRGIAGDADFEPSDIPADSVNVEASTTAGKVRNVASGEEFFAALYGPPLPY